MLLSTASVFASSVSVVASNWTNGSANVHLGFTSPSKDPYPTGYTRRRDDWRVPLAIDGQQPFDAYCVSYLTISILEPSLLPAAEHG